VNISQAVVSHYEEFVSNADLRYSFPPAEDSHRVTVSPLLQSTLHCLLNCTGQGTDLKKIS